MDTGNKKMAFNPKVSIIIPVYNGSNYMREAIDSALAQTYQNTEVIVVNDGSDDEGKTEAIAKSYGDKIRYFYKENGGVATALNFGIRKMEGEYFSWLSHDDIFYPEKTEKQIDFINDNPGVEIVFCNLEIIDGLGRITSKPYHQEGHEKLRGAIRFWDLFIYACTLLVHKSCLLKIGMINEEYRTTQDVEFILMLLHNYDVWHLKKILVQRRDHQESGYYRLNKTVLQELEALMFSLLNKYGILFFYSEAPDMMDSNIKAAFTYQKIGDLNFEKIHNFSTYCYQKSIELNPSLLNFSKYKYWILSSNSSFAINIYYQIKKIIQKINDLFYRIISVLHLITQKINFTKNRLSPKGKNGE